MYYSSWNGWLCLLEDSLIEPNPIQAFLEYIVFLLLDWFPSQAREPCISCYLIYINYSHILFFSNFIMISLYKLCIFSSQGLLFKLVPWLMTLRLSKTQLSFDTSNKGQNTVFTTEQENRLVYLISVKEREEKSILVSGIWGSSFSLVKIIIDTIFVSLEEDWWRENMKVAFDVKYIPFKIREGFL